MNVGLVIVSHSEKIAEGVCELAQQMAPDIRLIPAGGSDDGQGRAIIGTSLERTGSAIQAADAGVGVVILTDLGSAVMTAELALELLNGTERGRVRLARAALVEGAVAAAVEAQSGAGLDQVVQAAEQALVCLDESTLEPVTRTSVIEHTAAPPRSSPGDPGKDAEYTASGSWPLPNQLGLHARPAAELARGLSAFEAEVVVNGVDGKSVMLLMSLGLKQGAALEARAIGPDAGAAVELIEQLVTHGFGELGSERAG